MLDRSKMNRPGSQKLDFSPEESAPNLTAQVVATLREAILDGELTPGMMVSEDALKQILAGRKVGVSHMPVREAIRIFSAEKIMEVMPKKGTQLRVLGDAELKEVWDKRVALEEFVLVHLASLRERNIHSAFEINDRLRDLAGDDLYAPPSRDLQCQFEASDQAFHEALSEAAGYPRIAEELASLRFRLRYAAPCGAFATRHRMVSIVKEHDDILAALGSSDTLGDVRPDINQVRYAFLMHMRNAGRDSWRIASRLQSHSAVDALGSVDVFSLPTLATGRNNRRLPLAPLPFLFPLRLCAELCAVWNLASSKNIELKEAESLNAELAAIVRQCQLHGSLPRHLEIKAINIDITFHAMLCFLGGMLFGKDLVTFVWHSVYNARENEPLTAEKLEAIVKQHANILSSIRLSQGTPSDINAAISALGDHLLDAFARSGFGKEMREAVADTLKEWAGKIAE